MYYGDLSDSEQIANVMYNIRPDEVYHLGAQSHVRASFDIPSSTGNVTALGTTRCLRNPPEQYLCKVLPGIIERDVRFYIPAPERGQSLSPSQSLCLREGLFLLDDPKLPGRVHLFASNGILFNHESPRRGETFVTRKITRAIARILAGKEKYLYLGNLDAKRDWGFAPEYVECMWRILQQDKPGDFVIGTGETHSVREFLHESFEYAGLDVEKHVRIDPKYFRPTEVEVLAADAKKSAQVLGWKPTIKFADLVKIMVDADMKAIGLSPIGEGDACLAKKIPSRWWLKD